MKAEIIDDEPTFQLLAQRKGTPSDEFTIDLSEIVNQLSYVLACTGLSFEVGDT